MKLWSGLGPDGRALARILMKVQPPSPRQVESRSRTVNQHPLVPELADLLLETERLPGFEHTFLTTLGRLVRVRGTQPEMVLIVDDLSRIEQPNLFIWGADDPLAPVEIGERAAAAVLSGELHVVDGGHAPWLTEGETIGHLTTEFLSRHLPHARSDV